MIYCGQCGTPNPQGNKFCHNCGAALPLHMPSPPQPQPNFQAPPYQHQYKSPQRAAILWTKGFIIAVATILALVVILIVVVIHVSSTGEGVNVCAGIHFNSNLNVCTQSDKNISDTSASYLSVTGRNYQNFDGPAVMVVVNQENRDGNFTDIGSTFLSVATSSNSESEPLSGVLMTSQASFTHGHTYQIEVDDNIFPVTSLGTATFTYTGPTTD